MRRILSVAAVALMAVFVANVAAAQATKTVKGTVVKTGPDSMTVKVGEQDMTFKVDAETKLMARGGATAMRQARAQGKESVPYTNIIKTGQTVEVDYHENQMHAASVRVTGAAPAATPAAGPPPPPPPPADKVTTGVVTAVSDSSMTIKGSGGEVMFVIYGKTKVFGTGLSTKSRELKGAGQKTVFTEFVHKGDTVRVSYKEEGGTKTASEVRVTRKSTT